MMSCVRAGLMADAAGVRLLFVIAGIVMGALALVGFLTPAVMRIEEDNQHASIEPDEVLAEPQSI